MKIPRDISGNDLVRLLKPYGYVVVRQTGSHLRLVTTQNGQHHITIPNHNPLRIGTLSKILADVADHLQIPRDQIQTQLFS